MALPDCVRLGVGLLVSSGDDVKVSGIHNAKQKGKAVSWLAGPCETSWADDALRESRQRRSQQK